MGLSFKGDVLEKSVDEKLVKSLVPTIIVDMLAPEASEAVLLALDCAGELTHQELKHAMNLVFHLIEQSPDDLLEYAVWAAAENRELPHSEKTRAEVHDLMVRMKGRKPIDLIDESTPEREKKLITLIISRTEVARMLRERGLVEGGNAQVAKASL